MVLVAGNSHVFNQNRAARAPAAHQPVAADGDDRLEHVLEVAGDGDLLYREADLAALDPVTRRAARVVAGHQVYPLSHQLGDQQAASELAQHALEIRPRGSDEKVMVPAGAAGAGHAQLAGRVAAEEIALHRALAHDAAAARGDPLLVEGRARHAARLVRLLVDLHQGREHLLAQAVHQERGLAVQVAAVNRGGEVADQLQSHRRLEQYRRPARRDLARAQASERSLAGVAAERHGIGDLIGHAGGAVPVVALHAAFVLGNHRARQPMARARVAAAEAQAVGEHELRLLRRDRGAFGVADALRHGERRRLAAPREVDRLLGGQRPGMEKIELGRLARERLGVGQPGAIILRGMPRDGRGRLDRLADGVGGKIGSAGMAAPRLRALAPVHGHPDAAVAVVLYRVGEPLAHRDAEAVAFGNLALGAAGAGAARVLEHRLGETAKLAGLAAKAVVLRHGGAIITRVQDDFVSKTRRTREMLELQALGAALAELPQAQLAGLQMREELREALLEAKRITSHEAKRRQLQYVGRLMREVDPEPIRAALAAVEGSSAQAAAAHRRLEGLRERLLADDAALTRFALEHPGADLQELRALIRNARREQKEGKPPRAFRELFRVLKALETA